MTRYLVVQPLFHVDVPDTTDAPEKCDGGCCDASPAVAAPGPTYEANGVILARLAALLKNAISNAPQLIAEITTIIALFGGKVTPQPATV